ncbi:hypothetical protein ACGFS9_16640 [Streptomyces sp. NPDC048566]|uniref:hypothetical protein n=1 Tax=Streptomyces sp. NPDC048566 TaxID=3365569 RepID=UPI00371E5958
MTTGSFPAGRSATVAAITSAAPADSSHRALTRNRPRGTPFPGRPASARTDALRRNGFAPTP